MKKRIKAVIAGTAIAGIMATAAFGLAGHAGARPVTTSVMAGFSRSSHDEGKAGGPGVDAVTSVLGMTADELHMELHSGKSLATIAESKGVAVQKVIDAIVTEVKAHVADEVASGELTQAEADAKLADVTAKVTEMVNSTRPMRGEGGPRGERGGPGVDAVTSVLGMTADELHMELHSGKSLATIAESKGVAVQKVIDAIVTEVKAHVADEVASGELTQAEADAKLADVTAKVTEMVNSTRPMRGEGGPRGGHDRHGRGDHHGNNLPTAAVTETNA